MFTLLDVAHNGGKWVRRERSQSPIKLKPTLWTCPKAPSPASWAGNGPPNLPACCVSLVDVTLLVWVLSYGSLRPLNDDWWFAPSGKLLPVYLGFFFYFKLRDFIFVHLVCGCVCVCTRVHKCMSITWHMFREQLMAFSYHVSARDPSRVMRLWSKYSN